MLKFFAIASFLMITGLSFAMPPQGSPGNIQGKITETMDSGGYTYMKLSTQKGDVWAAVPQTNVKVGADAVIESPMVMEKFESKTLKRKFDSIFFGTLGSGKAGATSPMSKGMGMGMGKMSTGQPHGSAAPAVKLEEIKVAKAEGPAGKTVAQIYAEKAALKGKEVAVRGKVTKVAHGIMGKNWLHLSDGTGKLDQKNFDLTVSTTADAKTGDVVLLKGILATDKDIGAGYFYPVLLEDAKILK